MCECSLLQSDFLCGKNAITCGFSLNEEVGGAEPSPVSGVYVSVSWVRQ